MLNSGERQVATQPSRVRADHVARYEWAAKQLRRTATSSISAAASATARRSWPRRATRSSPSIATPRPSPSPGALRPREHRVRRRRRSRGSLCPEGGRGGLLRGDRARRGPGAVAADLRRGRADPLRQRAERGPSSPGGQEYAFHHRHYTRDQLLKDMLLNRWLSVPLLERRNHGASPGDHRWRRSPMVAHLIVEAHRAEPTR
jgi:hypothetical protein